MEPNNEAAQRLTQYLALRPSCGNVWLTATGYRVRVHNTVGRWIFSGELVSTWEGLPVEYDFTKQHISG